MEKPQRHVQNGNVTVGRKHKFTVVQSNDIVELSLNYLRPPIVQRKVGIKTKEQLHHVHAAIRTRQEVGQ